MIKILMLDVETAPNLATVWGIWRQNIGINQLHETSRVMCFSYQWYGDKTVSFYGEHETDHKEMMKKLHNLLCEADAVIHYNGNKFDMPVINREFLLYGWAPPSPYKNIDLLKVVRQNFKFVSNKLDFIAQELEIGEKVKHAGHELWLGCLDKDEESWATMKEYNKQDVALLGLLYDKLKPWIKNHPNHALYEYYDEAVCPNCGSNNLISRGVSRTNTLTYNRYQCNDCGSWSRERSTNLDKERRENVLTSDKEK